MKKKNEKGFICELRYLICIVYKLIEDILMGKYIIVDDPIEFYSIFWVGFKQTFKRIQ